MTINDTFIKVLAWNYFGGRMPDGLRAYLYDHYGEEPLEGGLSAVPAIRCDGKRYPGRELDIKVKTPLQKLRDCSNDLPGITCDFAPICRNQETKLRYTHNFSYWTRLDEQYRLFRENAHEKRSEDMPFSHHTMETDI